MKSQITSVRMSLADKMQTLVLDVYKEKSKDTFTFDCTDAFCKGSFRKLYIKDVALNVVDNYFPDEGNTVITFFNTLLSLSLYTNKLLNNERRQLNESSGELLDITEYIFQELADKCQKVSVLTGLINAQALDAYYKVSECLKEFGHGESL